MDTYFRKTRRIAEPKNLKRPPSPAKLNSPPATKILATPKTPQDARLERPTKPPPAPIKSRPQLYPTTPTTTTTTTTAAAAATAVVAQAAAASLTPTKLNTKRRLVTPRQLFESTKLTQQSDNDKRTNDIAAAPLATKLIKPLPKTSIIDSGPLVGVSKSLLELVRAKEAAAKAVDPKETRRRELLGIAPEIVRIVSTVFTASKRQHLAYPTVIDKCFKGLKSNYTTQTIEECLRLLAKITPDWISIIEISRGTFMRINRDRYTIAQILEDLKRHDHHHHPSSNSTPKPDHNHHANANANK